MERSEEELDILQNTYCTSRFRAGYDTFKGYTLFEAYSTIADQVENMEVYEDDIWVTSFPKCGTTWCQEMVWCIANDLDYEGAKVNVNVRYQFIEFQAVFDCRKIPEIRDAFRSVAESMKYAIEAKRPRYIKTHLPWDLLPRQIRTFEKRPKIIHINRNAKDVCVSYYHHSKLLDGYTGDFEMFTALFLNAKLGWTPFFESILSYWSNRHEPNVLIVKYENMKKDLSAVINEVAIFLGKNITEEETQTLLKHLSFDSMKQNMSVNRNTMVKFLYENNLSVDEGGEFMRSGKTGGYKSVMSPSTIALFDKLIEEKFGHTSLKL